MRSNIFVKVGFFVVGLFLISQLLRLISPIALLIAAGLWAYSKGYIS